MISFLRPAVRGCLALSLVVSAAVLTACGAGADGGSKALSDEQVSACMSRANAYLDDWREFPTTLPASPPARYTKLDKTPPKGKTIVVPSQNFPAALSTFKGVEAAADRLGWTARQVVFNGELPDLIEKLDAIIESRPDFIVIGGFPAATVQKQIDQAKAAGIIVIAGSTMDEPQSSPGLAAVTNGTETAKLIGELQAYKVLADSNCTANTAIFTLDYPILDVSIDAYKATVNSVCPDCKIDVVKIQQKDIGTPSMTQQMVAKLQAEPSIKYAYTIIGDLANGLAPKLEEAGVEGVKIFGEVPNENSIAALRDGTNAWWVNQAAQIQGIDAVDAAARVAVTGELQSDSGGYPLALLTEDNVPAGEEAPVIPENVLDLYAATWGVS